MKYYETPKPYKNYAVEVHIADIHFGSIDPQKQFAILNEQFLKPISTIDFDMV